MSTRPDPRSPFPLHPRTTFTTNVCGDVLFTIFVYFDIIIINNIFSILCALAIDERHDDFDAAGAKGMGWVDVFPCEPVVSVGAENEQRL